MTLVRYYDHICLLKEKYAGKIKLLAGERHRPYGSVFPYWVEEYRPDRVNFRAASFRRE